MSIAAWRLSYVPGPWLALAGPHMLVVLPHPLPGSEEQTEQLWQRIMSASGLDALVDYVASAGLGQVPDLAAFFWDENGLHGLSRGRVWVRDADTDELCLSGEGRLTWQESALGQSRRLRVVLGTEITDPRRLPLAVGAVEAGELILSTHIADTLIFTSAARTASPSLTPEPSVDPAVDQVPPHRDSSLEQDSVPLYIPHQPPAASLVGEETIDHVGDIAADGENLSGSLDKDSGTVSSPALAATHKPQVGDPQIVAVPCANGHPNSPSFLNCRICQASVDPSQPRLIARPVLAGVHTNYGDFVDVASAVVIGRAPDANVAPVGSQLMKVISPSNDISRNHLMVSTQGWSVTVTDLHSTNGTTVLPVGEAPFMLRDGASVEVAIGTVLDLGDGVSIRIEPPRG